MWPGSRRRVARLERQVAFLLQHLGLDPDLAAGVGQIPTFGTPSAGLPSPPANYGTAPSDFGAAPAGFSAPSSGYAAPSAAGRPAEAADDVPPAVLAALQNGKLIEAIKIYRDLTGLGLRESKDAVDAIARRLP